MNKVNIFSLVAVAETRQYLITLEEVSGTRLMPIWIGPSEGMAIAAVLAKTEFPRPLTHDLVINILKDLDAEIEGVVITDLKESTFYAAILLKTKDGQRQIDARPSDSIAIALRADAPIYIEDRVFDKCPRIEKPITQEEVEKFKADIKSLRPEDFFKEKKSGR